MTDFAEFIASSRASLLDRQARLYLELAEIGAELAAINAYEQAKRERSEKRTGRYPHPHDGTLSVPEAGKQYLGLSESGSWLAWRRGDIPSLKVGRYRRVPANEMRRKMEERNPPESRVREEEGYPGSLVPA